MSSFTRRPSRLSFVSFWLESPLSLLSTWFRLFVCFTRLMIRSWVIWSSIFCFYLRSFSLLVSVLFRESPIFTITVVQKIFNFFSFYCLVFYFSCFRAYFSFFRFFTLFTSSYIRERPSKISTVHSPSLYLLPFVYFQNFVSQGNLRGSRLPAPESLLSPGDP